MQVVPGTHVRVSRLMADDVDRNAGEQFAEEILSTPGNGLASHRRGP